MLNSALIIGGKSASNLVRKLNLGHGSTWPGHVALMLNPHFIRDMIRSSPMKIILIAGTNGKTTSSLMLRTVLEADGKRVLHNASGANLLNGIASTFLMHASSDGKIPYDYAIFEVDENALPKMLQEITPDYLLLLNLFRDQLDRYGEVATIAEKWKAAFKELPDTTVIVANADDPKTAYLGMQKKNSMFFGLPASIRAEKQSIEASDSIYCPRCNNKLTYKYHTYSHLGDWHCSKCKLKRPDINVSNNIVMSLSGTYNLYNAHGIIVVAHKLSTPNVVIAKALKTVQPAFGRQEKIVSLGKQTQLFLSKNPTGFNESLRTIQELDGKHILLVLNDGVADGTDVSWIWDIDLETYLPDFKRITISGSRAYDMGLRIKYALPEQMAYTKCDIQENTETAVKNALAALPKDATLYILPTYTAMLEVRKILTGRKIL